MVYGFYQSLEVTLNNFWNQEEMYIFPCNTFFLLLLLYIYKTPSCPPNSHCSYFYHGKIPTSSPGNQGSLRPALHSHSFLNSLPQSGCCSLCIYISEWSENSERQCLYSCHISILECFSGSLSSSLKNDTTLNT